MTPVEDVVFLSADAPVEENVERIGSSPHTRFPLVGDDPEDFLGIVYVPTVVDQFQTERQELTLVLSGGRSSA